MISERNRKTLLWSLSCSAILLAVWALLPARVSNAAGGPGAAGQAATPGKVFATVGGQAVTQAETEARVIARLLERQPNLLETALDELIEEKLVALEAAAQKTTPEALIEKEVAAKGAAPTDADVETFYEQNKGRVPPNITKEQVLPQIRAYLQNQRREQVLAALYDSLRSKYGVTNNLAEEKIQAEVAKAKELRPRLETGGVAKGPAEAPVVLVEFSDFECPFCARVLPAVQQALGKYGDKLRVVFRQFPLNDIHPSAQKAAEASLCAADQGKFWELHDAMFADQKGLGLDALKAKAAAVGLDAASFAECVDSGRKAGAVAADVEFGRSIGVSGTPAMYLNGRPIQGGAVAPEVLARLIDEELRRLGR